MSHGGPRSLALALALTCAGGALLAPRVASAEHTREERIIDQTAYTLPRGRFQIGILRQDWAPIDRLIVGTYALPWILRIVNAHAKLRLGGDPISLALSASVFYLRPDAWDEETGDASITAVPLELVASWRISDAFTFSPSVAYTAVTLRGSYNPAEAEGVAALSNLQLTGTLEWRLTRVTALVLHGRYLAFQNAGGRAASFTRPDAFTTVDVQAVASTDDLDFPHAYSIVPSMVFSWRVFNLRLGVGYGNYSIPGINLVLPKRTLIPDFDFYFRF